MDNDKIPTCKQCGAGLYFEHYVGCSTRPATSQAQTSASRDALDPIAGRRDKPGETGTEELGLNVDMTDVARLMLWANRLEEYGPNITEWGSVAFVVEKMRDIAARLDQEIRDVGKLRKQAAASLPPRCPVCPHCLIEGCKDQAEAITARIHAQRAGEEP